jgi:hypothetical protein
MRHVILTTVERWRVLWDAHAIVEVEAAATDTLITINRYIGSTLTSDTAISLIFAAGQYINTGDREQLDTLLATVPD